LNFYQCEKHDFIGEMVFQRVTVRLNIAGRKCVAEKAMKVFIALFMGLAFKKRYEEMKFSLPYFSVTP